MTACILNRPTPRNERHKETGHLCNTLPTVTQKVKWRMFETSASKNKVSQLVWVKSMMFCPTCNSILIHVSSEKLVKVQQGATHMRLCMRDSRLTIPWEELYHEV
jgi:hypothetical protein